jgi:hypothetical protein
MSGGTIFLIATATTAVVYFVAGVIVNHRRGEVGRDLLPHREFWWSFYRLVREGCIFSALRCAGGSKAAFKVGHSTFTRYEQL